MSFPLEELPLDEQFEPATPAAQQQPAAPKSNMLLFAVIGGGIALYFLTRKS